MTFSSLSPQRLRSSQPAVDIDGFFSSVDDALKLHLKQVHWPEGTSPTYVHQFPKERLAKADDPFDVITFHVGGAVMAPSSNDGQRVPVAPSLREVKPNPKQLGYNTSSLAWKEMVEVVFEIYSKSNSRADILTTWFHRFLMLYGHGYKFFMARGVDWFRFIQRGEDKKIKTDEGQECYLRTLHYQVRIEYLQTLLDKQIDNVSITVAIDGETDSIERP